MHKDALCLIRYASRDGQTVEWVYNTRDAGAPAIIWAKDEQTLLHRIAWLHCFVVPDYQPQASERVFVDLWYEEAEKLATGIVRQRWQNRHLPHPYKNQADAIAQQTRDLMGDGHAPFLVDASSWHRPCARGTKARVVQSEPLPVVPRVITPHRLRGGAVRGRSI